jgi:hypothetical protein
MEWTFRETLPAHSYLLFRPISGSIRHAQACSASERHVVARVPRRTSGPGRRAARRVLDSRPEDEDWAALPGTPSPSPALGPARWGRRRQTKHRGDPTASAGPWGSGRIGEGFWSDWRRNRATRASRPAERPSFPPLPWRFCVLWWGARCCAAGPHALGWLPDSDKARCSAAASRSRMESRGIRRGGVIKIHGSHAYRVLGPECLPRSWRTTLCGGGQQLEMESSRRIANNVE